MCLWILTRAVFYLVPLNLEDEESENLQAINDIQLQHINNSNFSKIHFSPDHLGSIQLQKTPVHSKPRPKPRVLNYVPPDIINIVPPTPTSTTYPVVPERMNSPVIRHSPKLRETTSSPLLKKTKLKKITEIPRYGRKESKDLTPTKPNDPFVPYIQIPSSQEAGMHSRSYESLQHLQRYYSSDHHLAKYEDFCPQWVVSSSTGYYAC